MEFNILNTDREWVAVVDHYRSAIWTPRFWECGDFELYVEANEERLSILKEDFYVTRPDDEMACVIEKVNIIKDFDGGNYIIATGRSLQCLLERRIVWEQTNLDGTVEDCIRRLITENIISPTDTARAIPNFILGTRKGYAETLEKQITGDDLLTVVSDLCKTYGYGFKITFDGSRNFVFDLYKGVDRSGADPNTPRVMFSPTFENVASIDYVLDKTNFKNAALVAGEGEGVERKTLEVLLAGETPSGENRYEMFVDARDLSSNAGTEDEISLEDYQKLMWERGNEALVSAIVEQSFAGEISPGVNYVYKQDYSLGDIVRIENEFGITASPRITEITECTDESGYSMIPTFYIDSGDDIISPWEDVQLVNSVNKALATAQKRILTTTRPSAKIVGETIYSNELSKVQNLTDADSVILGIDGDFVTCTVAQLKSVFGVPTMNNEIDTLQTGLSAAQSNISALQTGLSSANTQINNLGLYKFNIDHNHDGRYQMPIKITDTGTISITSAQWTTSSQGQKYYNGPTFASLGVTGTVIGCFIYYWASTGHLVTCSAYQNSYIQFRADEVCNFSGIVRIVWI